jgi:glycosyltransferase involved in cell wall biosynthesis
MHAPEPTDHSHFQKLRGWQRSQQETTVFSQDEQIACEFGSQSSLSVIIPAKNEALSLPHLVSELILTLRPLCTRCCEPPARRLSSFEIIVVDDGSTDSTPLVLTELAVMYPELRSLRLKATAGQSAATVAGFRAARGSWLATLDADLQNDPANLSTLWSALPGHDVALGWRVRRHDSWSKRLISYLANQVRNLVLAQSIYDTGCSVRIFRRDIAFRLPLFKGVHRFLGPLFLREGCRIVQVPVNHRPRAHGRSHYNLWNRSLRVIVDLIGVAWLLRRPVFYQILSDDETQVHTHPEDPGYQTRKQATGSLSPVRQRHGMEAS